MFEFKFCVLIILCQNQTNYIIPSIKDLWGRMKEKIWSLFQRENLVMCGDGRMDCPGFSAKYCFYVMMDHSLP